MQNATIVRTVSSSSSVPAPSASRSISATSLSRQAFQQSQAGLPPGVRVLSNSESFQGLPPGVSHQNSLGAAVSPSQSTGSCTGFRQMSAGAPPGAGYSTQQRSISGTVLGQTSVGTTQVLQGQTMQSTPSVSSMGSQSRPSLPNAAMLAAAPRSSGMTRTCSTPPSTRARYQVTKTTILTPGTPPTSGMVGKTISGAPMTANASMQSVSTSASVSSPGHNFASAAHGPLATSYGLAPRVVMAQGHQNLVM